jgi:hypothetical protein
LQALLAGISNKQWNFPWKGYQIKKNLLMDYKFMMNFNSGTTSLEKSYCYSATNQRASPITSHQGAIIRKIAG